MMISCCQPVMSLVSTRDAALAARGQAGRPGGAHSGKVRSIGPTVPNWLRIVKDDRMARLRFSMQMPLTMATRRLF